MDGVVVAVASKTAVVGIASSDIAAVAWLHNTVAVASSHVVAAVDMIAFDSLNTQFAGAQSTYPRIGSKMAEGMPVNRHPWGDLLVPRALDHRTIDGSTGHTSPQSFHHLLQHAYQTFSYS